MITRTCKQHLFYNGYALTTGKYLLVQITQIKKVIEDILCCCWTTEIILIPSHPFFLNNAHLIISNQCNEPTQIEWHSRIDLRSMSSLKRWQHILNIAIFWNLWYDQIYRYILLKWGENISSRIVLIASSYKLMKGVLDLYHCVSF